MVNGKPYIWHIWQTYLVGGLNPSEKYESQLGWWHPQYFWENKKWQPNHQPDTDPNEIFPSHHPHPPHPRRQSRVCASGPQTWCSSLLQSWSRVGKAGVLRPLVGKMLGKCWENMEKRWENLWEHGEMMGKLVGKWRNAGKTWWTKWWEDGEMLGQSWKNGGTMEKCWKNGGKLWI